MLTVSLGRILIISQFLHVWHIMYLIILFVCCMDSIHWIQIMNIRWWWSLACLVISGRCRWMDILPLTQETAQEDNNYCLIASRRWMMGICAILISIPNFGKRKLSETIHRAETIYRATQNMKWPWFCRRPLTLSHKLTQPIHSKTDPHTLGKNHFREKWLISVFCPRSTN